MIALLERVKRLRPPPVPPNPGGEVGSPLLRLGLGPLRMDQRGATLVTYVLVLPLLILLIFGSFAVWRIMAIRQTLFLGTYKAAWELSWQGRDLGLDNQEEKEKWVEIAYDIIEAEVKGNHLVDIPPDDLPDYLDVTVTHPIELACPRDPDDSRPIDDILFTVEATLTLPTPIRIPFLDPINLLTLTEQHTSYVECPRGWDPPEEEHIY
jgi:hypothetical protein